MASQAGRYAFDLNIDRVLEHWTVPFAVREVIANALDEQALTGSAAPEIRLDASGDWHVRDFGRGLRYQHLSQNESDEKRRSDVVIGQFGVGLKDALAVFERRGVGVTIRSRHADVRIGRRSKADFPDVVVLHALVDAPSEPDLVGTDVVLSGVTEEQVDEAKSLFLLFCGDPVVESTSVGQVLAKQAPDLPGRIYVKGLLVAEEPNFLFSYNITALNTPLRRALNRERSNVGRTAYTDRVKKILTACSGHAVAAALSADLAEYETGRVHDEISSWTDVAIHACRMLQTHEKVVFVTAQDLAAGSPQLVYARDDGYRLVVVPASVASKLSRLSDLDGNPMVDLSRYRTQWNDSFSFTFVSGDQLTPGERAVFERAEQIIELAGGTGVRQVLLSETMRMSESGDMTLGLWQPAEQTIVVRRDQLASTAAFAGVLLHELSHATSGETDGSLGFENELTRLLGVVAAAALEPAAPEPATV
ncbi:ATP-binding protein [Actinomycetes bacterium KLBMP 9759]